MTRKRPSKRELDFRHRGRVMDPLKPPLRVICDECGFEAGSLEEFAAHVEALLPAPPKTKEEAVTMVLADHLGALGDEGGAMSLAPHVAQLGEYPEHIFCGCGWHTKEPVDNDEFRAHLADAILTELDKVQEEK